jgi:hypothetical protein
MIFITRDTKLFVDEDFEDFSWEGGATFAAGFGIGVAFLAGADLGGAAG